MYLLKSPKIFQRGELTSLYEYYGNLKIVPLRFDFVKDKQ